MIRSLVTAGLCLISNICIAGDLTASTGSFSRSSPLIPGAVRFEASVFGLRETSDRNPR